MGSKNTGNCATTLPLDEDLHLNLFFEIKDQTAAEADLVSAAITVHSDSAQKGRRACFVVSKWQKNTILRRI